MDITGKVVHAMEARSGVSQRNGNPWMSRDYVLEIPGQYPKHFVFTVFGEDRIKQFALRKDETVTVQFDIDANEYQGKWYNKVTAWNVIRPADNTAGTVAQQPAAAQPAPQQAQATSSPPQPQAPQTDGGTDDLPF